MSTQVALIYLVQQMFEALSLLLTILFFSLEHFALVAIMFGPLPPLGVLLF